MSEKKPTLDEAQDEQLRVEVRRSEMVNEILGKLGPDGTLAFWMMLNHIPSEDRADASILRQVKEEYLHGNDQRIVLVILGMLKSFESDPAAPVLNRFFAAMREHTTFGFAQKCADVLEGRNEPARRKVLDAMATLKSLFEETLVQIKISDLSIN
jgi:hypothetical protein